MMLAQTTVESAFWLSLCAVCVVLSGIYSAAETGMYCLNRLRLSVAAHRRDRAASALLDLLADRPSLLSTTLLGTNLANYLAPLSLTVLFIQAADAGLTAKQAGARAELYTALILTPIIFIFGEIVPKNIFQRHADRLMPRVANILLLTRWFFRMTGLIGVQRGLSQFVLRRLPTQPSPAAVLGSRVEMYQLLHEGAAEGNLTRTQISMLESVHKLRSVPVSTVMTPLSRVVMLEALQRRDQIDAVLRHSLYARMPVYESERRHVVGVVHLLDIVDAAPATRVGDVMQPIVRIGPGTPILDALSRLQKERHRMAAIESSTGRCEGIVTVKDLVEEIVGDLTAW
ncbi:MAG: hypothetical protein DCC65_02635 [Planctomycetota bacterium]|nr:MAG: hypothetical protein DCC65_02635 [Planctomycetota bacterium]